MKRREVQGKGSFFFFLFIILLFFFPTVGQAEQADTEEKMGFAVESIIPENQVDTTKTYFYLAMEPNQTQTIQVKLRNLQDAPITIQIKVHTAVSSSVGAIDYAKDKPKLDKSLTEPITDLVKRKDGTEEVTLKASEEKTVSFDITTPKTAFSGVKLGSLRFVRKNEEAKSKQKS